MPARQHHRQEVNDRAPADPEVVDQRQGHDGCDRDHQQCEQDAAQLAPDAHDRFLLERHEPNDT
jgi:hypothetical protein